MSVRLAAGLSKFVKFVEFVKLPQLPQCTTVQWYTVALRVHV